MSVPTQFMKQGDLLPLVTSVLTDYAGNPIDLSTATVRFVMRLSSATSPTVNALAQQNPDQTGHKGEVTYRWVAGDTATPGSYRAEWHVTLASGATQTYPTNGFLAVEIARDLVTSTTGPGLYCSPNDLLLGDLQVPATVNIDLYVARACDDINIALGQRFVIPIVTGTGTTPIILKSVAADLASAYLLFAQAQGGEDNTVNAYAKHLYDRAWDRLLPYRMGDVLPGAALNPALTGSSGAISLTQQDPNSILTAYEVFVTTPPSYASVFSGQPYGEGAIYGYPDGPQ